MAPVQGLRAAWNTAPLARRMVLLIVFILTVALATTGTVLLSALQRQLLQQVDEQLVSSAGRLTNEALAGEALDRTFRYPTDYYVRSDIFDKQSYFIISPETERRAGKPLVEGLSHENLPLTSSGTTAPVTVLSSKPGATWRVVAVPVVDNTEEIVGAVTVGLPLVGTNATVLNASIWFLFTSTVIVFAGGLLGYYLVSRSLRPLRQIESVAEKIAAGDLSKRIPPAEPGTEVGSLAESLNGMLAQIERSFTARDESEQKVRRFVSDASHELRTPLAAIRGYGELYRMGGVPPERIGDVMERIESESTRMGNLVEDLLVLARLDEKRPLTLTEVDLVRLAKEAASDLEALDPTRPVKVQGLGSRKPPQQVFVQADRDQLTQVAVNLLGNIARYTPASSPVEILVGEENGWAVLVFRDHGPGIDAAEQDLVFERFYRTDRSRARSLGGSGLGLSIVAGIVEAHNGTVKLSDTRKGGLTVRLQLPLI